MVKKRIICSTVIVVLFLFLIGCGFKGQDYMRDKEEVQKEEIAERSGLANPASMYCMNQTDNSWSIKEDAKGNQYGVCRFSDGSWCEEWAYYRGHCEPGLNYTKCEGQFWGKAVCPPDYAPVCAKVRSGIEEPYDFRWETFSSPCNACLVSTDQEQVVGYVLGKCE